MSRVDTAALVVTSVAMLLPLARAQAVLDGAAATQPAWAKIVITPGTGLEDTSACDCLYCGQKTGQDRFWIKEQIKYVYSVGVNGTTAAVLREFKKFGVRPSAQWGF